MLNGCWRHSLGGSKTKRTSVADRAPAKIGMRPNVSARAATDAANEARLDIAFRCESNSCRYPIFLVHAPHDDLERIIRQRPLQRLRLVPRRTHPHVALLA